MVDAVLVTEEMGPVRVQLGAQLVPAALGHGRVQQRQSVRAAVQRNEARPGPGAVHLLDGLQQRHVRQLRRHRLHGRLPGAAVPFANPRLFAAFDVVPAVPVATVHRQRHPAEAARSGPQRRRPHHREATRRRRGHHRRHQPEQQPAGRPAQSRFLHGRIPQPEAAQETRSEPQ